MKIFIISIVSITLLFLIPTCSNQNKPDGEARIDSARNAYFRDFIFNSRGDEEIIRLLAIKYSLNEEVANRILDEYEMYTPLEGKMDALLEAKSVEDIEKLKIKNDSLSVANRVRKISIEYDEPQAVIASLIIDYKIWYEASNDE